MQKEIEVLNEELATIRIQAIKNLVVLSTESDNKITTTEKQVDHLIENSGEKDTPSSKSSSVYASSEDSVVSEAGTIYSTAENVQYIQKLMSYTTGLLI